MASIVKVRFATNRARVHDTRLFGETYQVKGHPERYVTGAIDVAHVDPSKPDNGWEPIDRTLVIDSPVKALAPMSASVRGQTPARGILDFLESTRAVKALAGEATGLILIHGFAASFKDSMRRAAQVKAGYGAAEIFCFSWPTRGNVSLGDYAADLTTSEESAPAIADALAQYFAKASSGRRPPKVALVAHSMGNFALRHALQAIKSTHPDLLRKKVFRRAFLMAADERYEALSDEAMLKPIFRLADRTAVYHSGGDLACKLGEIVSPKTSLGLWGPAPDARLPAAPKLMTIDCSDVGQTRGDDGETHWGHQYYRCSPRVVSDVRQVLQSVDCIYGRIPDPARPGDRRAWRLTFDPNTGPGCELGAKAVAARTSAEPVAA